MDKNGIEYQFVESWEEWDELAGGCFLFMNVQLRKDVFPEHLLENTETHLEVDTSECLIRVYQPDTDDSAPVFFSKFTVQLQGDK